MILFLQLFFKVTDVTNPRAKSNENKFRKRLAYRVMKNDTKSRLQSANTFKLTGINTSQKSSYNNLEIFEGNLSKNI